MVVSVASICVPAVLVFSRTSVPGAGIGYVLVSILAVTNPWTQTSVSVFCAVVFSAMASLYGCPVLPPSRTVTSWRLVVGCGVFECSIVQTSPALTEEPVAV